VNGEITLNRRKKELNSQNRQDPQAGPMVQTVFTVSSIYSSFESAASIEGSIVHYSPQVSEPNQSVTPKPSK
jgi:hypothetical protein